MPDQDPEARRLADQRQRDLDAGIAREVDRARAQGKRDAEEEAARLDTSKRFEVINGSIADFANELRGVKNRLTRMEGAMATGDAVERALNTVADRSGAKRFSRLQAIGIVITGLVAIGVFTISLITALGH